MRALYPFIVAIVVLWAAPRNAHAQVLYVTNRPEGGAGVVSEYNAISGEVINAEFITQLDRPFGLAVFANTLFVADEGNNRVNEYNAISGQPIEKSSFITGLKSPKGLAVKLPTLEFRHSILFVVNFNDGTVGAYSAITGAAFNANFISGLAEPVGLALKGNILFVAEFDSNSVGEYDPISGKTIDASFITGLKRPKGLAVMPATPMALSPSSSWRTTTPARLANMTPKRVR